MKKVKRKIIKKWLLLIFSKPDIVVRKTIDNLNFRQFSTIGGFFRHPGMVVLFVLSAIIFTGCEKNKTEDEERERIIREMLPEISSDSLEAHVRWLQGMGTRFAFAPNNKTVARDILKKFESMGYANAKLDSFIVSRTYKNVYYSVMQYNVIATIEGTEYPDSVCILGAHYDDIVGTGDPLTFAPGAHDNASGTAAALEVARVMKKKDYKPSKTIMFVAFGAEELGLYGSYAFTSDPEKYGKIAFMINNDMIAYETSGDRNLWAVNILDYDNSHYLRSFAEKVIARRTGLHTINDNYYNRFSDSWPFAQAGFKAIFFSSVKNDPYYHTDSDVFMNLNFDYCREITMASCAILMERN